MVAPPSSAMTLLAKMQQEQEQHQQAIRASALTCATGLLAADSDEADALLADLLPTGSTGVRRLELLANTLLTYIETGKFLENHD